MKIIAWNCNMAFRKKADFILAEKPDILIVPECENRERLALERHTVQPADFLWYGNNPNKGIGIFSYSDFTITLLDIHNPDFPFVLPLLVCNSRIKLVIFAIWSQKPAKNDNYTEQVWNAVHFYSDLLDSDNVILAGDFNSNSIWDRPRRVANHSSLVAFLETKKIFSTYHHFHAQVHGQEKDHTLYLHRKKDRPYHLDYIFASSNLIDKLTDVTVGDYDTWTSYSDHKPIKITLDL